MRLTPGPDHKSFQLTKANAFKFGPKTILLTIFIDHIITLLFILVMRLDDNNFLKKIRLIIKIDNFILFILGNLF